MQQEDRRGGDPDAFADPVGQHRRRDRRPNDQHEQREVLHIAHPALLIFKLCLIV
jgi:hypothetical protein